MSDIFSDLCNFDDDIDKLHGTLNNTISKIEDLSVQTLSRLDKIISDNGQGFINNSKHTALEVLSRAGKEIKQDILDVIKQFTDNMSNGVDSAIEHARNATTDVLDEGLVKMRYEANILLENIITNRLLIIAGVFILIILFSVGVCLFRYLSKETHWYSKLFEILSNMLLIMVVFLTFLWFLLALVSFFEKAIDKKDPFYIVGTIILLFVNLYGICHLCWFVTTKVSNGCKLPSRTSDNLEDPVSSDSNKIYSKH